MTIRCRFAPAPSGSIHVGNARSALFSWLYARRHEGVFILRVEDTDVTRVTEEAYRGVVEDLRWLGLDWDEGPDVGGPHGPYRQSERLDIYREMTQRLLDGGQAYRCFCTPEELEERRKAALARGEPPGYDGRCRTRPDEEIAAFQQEGRPFAIRFHMPEREWMIDDLVKGEVRWAAGDLRDFVIVRSDGSPVFLLAVSVDDMLMEVTHVVRGEDLLASAPRNAAVIESLGGSPPSYAHLPLVLGHDSKPLSKRHGATSIAAFREQGLLPEAMVNYLALLGWSLDDHTTFFSRDELVKHFDLDRVSRNPAAFDREKLEWLNGHYIREMPADGFAGVVRETLADAGIAADPQLVAQAVPLIQERMKLLAEAPALLRFLFEEVAPDKKARKMLDGQSEYLAEVAKRLEALGDWTPEAIEAEMRAIREERGLGAKKAFQPVRAAVTGTLISPPLFESLALLGRERTLERIRAAAGS